MSRARLISKLIDNTGAIASSYLDLSGYYTKSETETKIVALSPPTDLTAVNAAILDNEEAVVNNAAAIIASQNAIIANHAQEIIYANINGCRQYSSI